MKGVLHGPLAKTSAVCGSFGRGYHAPLPILDASLCKCPICMETMYGGIVMCQQGHGVCAEGCFSELPDPKKCPQCRAEYGSGPTRGLLVEQLIGAAVWPCKFGCGHHCPGAKMREHIAACPARPFQCCRCAEVVTNRSVRQHFLNKKHSGRQASKDQSLGALSPQALRTEAMKLGVSTAGPPKVLLQRVLDASPWKCCNPKTWDIEDSLKYTCIATCIYFGEQEVACLLVRFSEDLSGALLTAHASGGPRRCEIEVGQSRSGAKAAFTMMSRPLGEVRKSRWSADEGSNHQGLLVLTSMIEAMCAESSATKIPYSLSISP